MLNKKIVELSYAPKLQVQACVCVDASNTPKIHSKHIITHQVCSTVNPYTSNISPLILNISIHAAVQKYWRPACCVQTQIKVVHAAGLKVDSSAGVTQRKGGTIQTFTFAQI